jgi:hypothetical protein
VRVARDGGPNRKWLAGGSDPLAPASHLRTDMPELNESPTVSGGAGRSEVVEGAVAPQEPA